MIVRNMKKSDPITKIKEVYLDSLKEAYKDFVSHEFFAALDVDGWLKNVDDKNFFVMLQGNEIIGTASISEGEISDDEIGEIESIYLNHDYVDQGYGRLLLNAMVKELYERGYEKVFLWDVKENLRSQAFYEKNGFVLTQETKVLEIGNEKIKQVKYILDIEDDFVIR